MKLLQNYSRSLLVIAALPLLVAGCKQISGKIPFNEARARQQVIPVKQGSEYSVRFVDLRDKELPRVMVDSSFLSKRFSMPIAETFNRDAIISLLNADGADGVRVYFGTDEKGLVKLVLLPVDKNGADIVTKLIPTLSDKASARGATDFPQDGQCVENGQRPPPPASALIPGN